MASRPLNNINEQKNSRYRYRGLVLLIFACYLFYLFVRASTGYYYIPPNSLVVQYSIGGSTLATVILYIGYALTVVLGILEYRKVMTIRYFAYAIFIFIPILFWLLSDVFEYPIRSILAITTINPFTFFILIAAYAGMNPKTWDLVLRLCRIIAPILILLSAAYTVHFFMVYGARPISNSPQIMYLSAGFWPLAVWALCNDTVKKDVLTVVLMIIALFCSVLYNSRGWVIQCILLIVIYFIFKNKKHSAFKPLAIMASIFVLVGVAYFLAMRFVPDRITSLLWKFNMGFSSRQWQYDSLFSQYSFSDILFGKGSFATYETEEYGRFMYFDNAFMNIILKYGILPSVLFLIAILHPMLSLLFSHRSFYSKGPAIILFLFFLAIMGVSVFCTVSIDLKFFIISILMGRCDYLKRTSDRSNALGKKAVMGPIYVKRS